MTASADGEQNISFCGRNKLMFFVTATQQPGDCSSWNHDLT
jgi:hypothetical protein